MHRRGAAAVGDGGRAQVHAACAVNVRGAQVAVAVVNGRDRVDGHHGRGLAALAYAAVDRDGRSDGSCRVVPLAGEAGRDGVIARQHRGLAIAGAVGDGGHAQGLHVVVVQADGRPDFHRDRVRLAVVLQGHRGQFHRGGQAADGQRALAGDGLQVGVAGKAGRKRILAGFRRCGIVVVSDGGRADHAAVRAHKLGHGIVPLAIVENGGLAQHDRRRDLGNRHRGAGRDRVVEIIAVERGRGRIGAYVGRHFAAAVGDPCGAQVGPVRADHVGRHAVRLAVILGRERIELNGRCLGVRVGRVDGVLGRGRGRFIICAAGIRGRDRVGAHGLGHRAVAAIGDGGRADRVAAHAQHLRRGRAVVAVVGIGLVLQVECRHGLGDGDGACQGGRVVVLRGAVKGCGGVAAGIDRGVVARAVADHAHADRHPVQAQHHGRSPVGLGVVGGRHGVHHDCRRGFVDGHLAIGRQWQIVQAAGILGRHAVGAGVQRQAHAAVSDRGRAEVRTGQAGHVRCNGVRLAVVGDLLGHKAHRGCGAVDGDLA